MNMHYEPNWKKSEFCSGCLKSIDFNMDSKLFNIIEYQGHRKECLKQIAIDNIKEIKLNIHHSIGRERSLVYLNFFYLKNVRNGCVTVYLPWKYDRKMKENLQEIAMNFNIPFYIEKNTGTFLGMLFLVIIVPLIYLFVKYLL